VSTSVPATPPAPQDDSAPDWSWPPAADDLEAIAHLEPRRAVAVVYPPLTNHDLEWPPSEADLATVVAVSLDDDGVRRLASSFTARPRSAPPPRRRRRVFLPAAVAACGLLWVGTSAWRAPRPTALDSSSAPSAGAVRAVGQTSRKDGAPESTQTLHRSPAADASHAAAAGPGVPLPPAVARKDEDAGVSAIPTALVIPAREETLVDAGASAVTLAAAPPLPGDTAPPVLGSMPSSSAPGGLPLDTLNVPPEPSRREPMPVTSDARATPAAVSRPLNEEPAIRAVLEEYGTAYSRLDARAARAVWPAVDEQALARAFNALESQKIAFERCEVHVDGSAAQAACRGVSTWVPRVGERRPRRDAREWTFRLERRADAQWRIRSASMR